MRKPWLFNLLALGFLVVGLLLLTRLLEPILFDIVNRIRSFMPSERASFRLQLIGLGSSLFGIIVFMAGRNLDKIQALAQKYEYRKLRWSQSLDKTLAGIFDRSRTFYNEAGARFLLSSRDYIFFIVCGLFAIFFFIVRLNDAYPVVVLGGDAGNLASFAAAWDNPQLFVHDFLLYDLSNIQIYATIHIPLIRFIHRFTSDYALAFVIILIPAVFIHLVGYFLLGRAFFQSRYWAAIFTVLVGMPIHLNLGELWGILWDPLPRFLFQALLPYLLLLVLLWQDKPYRWPFLAAGAGLLVYVHPVSTPAWSVAIFLTFIFLLPKPWSLRRKAGWIVVLVLVWAASILPFVLNYFKYHVKGSTQSYYEVLSIIQHYLPANLLNIKEAVGLFLERVGPLGPASLVSFVILLLAIRGDNRPFKIALVWLSSIVLVSIMIPYIEREIEQYFRVLPFETELVRGIRYIVPMMWLSITWSFREIGRRSRIPSMPIHTAILGAGLVAVAVFVPPSYKYSSEFTKAIQCFTSGSVLCKTEDPFNEMIEFVRDSSSQDDSILTNLSIQPEKLYGLPIRYASLRSLAFSFKDRGLLTYSNEERLLVWERLYSRLRRVRFDHDLESDFIEYGSIADKLGASLILLDVQIPAAVAADNGAELVFKNGSYYIYRHQRP